METLTEADRRVAIGASLLDQKVPGWVTTIDLDNLYTSSCYMCVLGQVYGEFIHGQLALQLTEKDCVEAGFERELGWNTTQEPDRLYQELDVAWKRLILQRSVLETETE